MSRTGPDMITSKSNVGDKILGDSDNNKFWDQKKGVCKKRYHGAIGGTTTTTTKFEGIIEVFNLFLCMDV